jgi:transposase
MANNHAGTPPLPCQPAGLGTTNERNPRRPGRNRLDNRKVLCGTLFVLHTGIQWEYLPQELGFGSGMTCWRRLDEWNRAGMWQRLYELLLAELQGAGKLDWSRGRRRLLPRADGRTRPKSGPSPVDRARPGSKHHVLTESAGIPLCVSLTGGNRNYITQLLPLIDKIPPVRGRRAAGHDGDRTRCTPTAPTTTTSTAASSTPRHPHHIARRGQPHGSGLGKARWVVDRTIAWYRGIRRLRMRWETPRRHPPSIPRPSRPAS